MLVISFDFLGVAAKDLFAFTCSNWKGTDDRIIKNAVADVNPLLSISVIQKTTEAVLELEPILSTSKITLPFCFY